MSDEQKAPPGGDTVIHDLSTMVLSSVSAALAAAREQGVDVQPRDLVTVLAVAVARITLKQPDPEQSLASFHDCVRELCDLLVAN